MTELAVEREHLVQADDDIADGERRITGQMLLIERLREAGCDTGGAEGVLATLRQTLAAWQDHRDLILCRIAHLERPARP